MRKAIWSIGERVRLKGTLTKPRAASYATINTIEGKYLTVTVEGIGTTGVGTRTVAVVDEVRKAPQLLRNFPTILYAFEMILDDQPYPPFMQVRILPEVEVRINQIPRFRIAEVVLAIIKSHTLLSLVLPSEMMRQGYSMTEFEMSENALSHVVLPVNDEQHLFYRKANIPLTAAKKTDRLLNDFFDGPLRQQFQSQPKRHIA